jgi:hypothetical protein
MDLDAIHGLEELALGACLLLLPSPLLAWGAKEDRRLVAAAPGVLGFTLFTLAFAHLHLAAGEASDLAQSAYGIGAVAAALLLVPSALSLRNRWLGVLHLATLAGVLWSWFIGAMLLARDGL